MIIIDFLHFLYDGTGITWFTWYKRKSLEQEVVTSFKFMIKFQSFQVRFICLKLHNALQTFFLKLLEVS